MRHLKGMNGGNRMEHMKEDKMLLVEKYNLKHENNAWYSEKENSHKHLIFKDAFFERADLIGLLFSDCPFVGCRVFKTQRFGLDS